MDKSSNVMQIFVINLDRHAERLAWMNEHLGDLSLTFSRMAAVDGLTLSQEEIGKLYDDTAARRMLERSLTLPELGCALSHLKVMRRMVAENIPVALVLEDDALLSPEMPTLLCKLKLALHPDVAQIALLNHIGKYRVRGARPLGVGAYALYEHYEGFNAHGYVITRAGAQEMLNYFIRIRHPIDYWATLRRSAGIEISALVPYAIGHSELAANSAIEDDRLGLLGARPHGPWRKARDFGHKYLYRKLIYQLMVKPFLSLKKQPHGGLEARIKRSHALRSGPKPKGDGDSK